MTRLIKIVIACIFLFVIQTDLAQSQAASDSINFTDRAKIHLNTNLFFLNGKNLASGHLVTEPGDKFYNNSLFEMAISYSLNEHLSLQGGITYTGFKQTNESGIMFVYPPPENSITRFRTTHRFVNLALEPKVLLEFDFHNWDFFWSAGPMISGSFLKTDIDGATNKVDSPYQDYKKLNSKSFGLGAQASTGVRYFFNDFVGLNLEIGYRYQKHGTLHTVFPIEDGSQPMNYSMNNLIQRIGLVFSL